MKRDVKKSKVSNTGSNRIYTKSTVRKTALKRIPAKSGVSLSAGMKPKGQTGTPSIFSYNSADDKNVLAIIDAVRTGISVTEFNKIVGNTPFSMAEWASYLQLSERTIQRNQKEMKAFQPIQSERIVELVMLYEYGVEVFGDKENFNVWLNSHSIALGGRYPKEFLDTKFGIDMVKDALGRIEHGVLA